jgi:hypothetical protein
MRLVLAINQSETVNIKSLVERYQSSAMRLVLAINHLPPDMSVKLLISNP